MQAPTAIAETMMGMRKKRMTADSVFSLATWVGVFALGVGVICAVAVAVSGKIRDDDLKVELANARADSAKAEAKAKVADERTAALKTEGEKLRAANLVLEGRIAPRRLETEQQSKLSSMLLPFKGKKIRLESYALDAEGEVLASQIRDAIKPIFGIDDWVGSDSAGNGFTKGINVTGNDAELVAAIAHALMAVGLHGVSMHPLPVPQVLVLALEQSRSKDPNVSAVVTVGVKPLNP